MANNPLHPELVRLYEELMTGAREVPVAVFLGPVADPKWAGNLMVHVLDTIVGGGTTDRADTSDPDKFRAAILTILKNKGKY